MNKLMDGLTDGLTDRGLDGCWTRLDDISPAELKALSLAKIQLLMSEGSISSVKFITVLMLP